MDNFRGFKDTTVPILDVNFLVGENSTGKTSLLMALRMLTSRALIFGAQTLVGLSELPTHGIEMGHFEEMVSVHSKDKSYFRLGLIRSESKQKSAGFSVDGILVTFRERDGLPSIARITCRSENNEISLRFTDDSFTFYVASREPMKAQSEMATIMQSWATQHMAVSEAGWKKSSVPKGLNAKHLPLFLILSIAASSSKGKQSDLGSTMPSIGPEVIWIAPIRTKALRTYDDPHTNFSPEGTHTPYIIRRMLESAEKAEEFRRFIDKVGKSSGLFEKIEIKYFNAEKSGPFEVDALIDGEALSLGWLGYGVSQSLPIIVELIFRPKRTCFAIQQPEVHLHPRAQASLGDVFFEMAFLDRKTFVVETHSDFTIDRFRMNYRAKRSAKERGSMPKSQVLFFERYDKRNIVTPVEIDKDGALSADQPDSYRTFFLKEEIRLIGSS